VLEDVELATEWLVLLVIVHDGVREEVAVPVSDKTDAFGSGEGDHLIDDTATKLVRHDVQGVIDADNQRLLVELVETIFGPPIDQFQGVGKVEFTMLVGMVFTTKVDKLLVNVDPDAGDLDW
jgi:hypothetical protein